MDLFVCSVTLREVVDEGSRFPKRLRQLLCRVVKGIGADGLADALSKNETDPDNFDARLEADLRRMAPSLSIKANCPISDRTKFNNDLVIEADDALVCLEIEKGNLARFEFDVLKMQAFASRWKHELSGKPVFGAFVVPADNIVARHISGNTGESSHRYLARLCRLIAQIQMPQLEDILVVGYTPTAPLDKKSPGRGKRAGERQKRTKATDNLLVQQNGLLPEEILRDGLRGYPTDLIFRFRRQLADACPKLREKFNRNSRYLGYGIVGGSDRIRVIAGLPEGEAEPG